MAADDIAGRKVISKCAGGAAAPLAAGAAANLLEAYPTYTSSQIRSMLVGNAANVTLANAGTGSPSKLLYAKIP